MTIDYLTKAGFVVKHLIGKWYLVRLYAKKSHPFYHIIFPIRITEKSQEQSMTNEEAINIFETELECITRDCDMDCEDCDFIVKYEDFKESRNLAIEALRKMKNWEN